MQLLGGTHIFAQRLHQRFEQARGSTDPIGQGRALEIHTGTAVDRLLPIQRTMIGVLGYDHLREQTRSRQAALDRP